MASCSYPRHAFEFPRPLLAHLNVAVCDIALTQGFALNNVLYVMPADGLSVSLFYLVLAP